MFGIKRNLKLNSDPIQDAIQHRNRKSFMKHVDKITLLFEKWLLYTVEQNLKETNKECLAYINISAVRNRIEFGDNFIPTSTFTYEVYSEIKAFLSNFCDKYGFKLEEKGQLNSVHEGRNGVDIWICL